MMKYNEVKLTYTCPAAPPPGLYMDKIYTIGKDKKGFYFTDGNYMEHVKDSDIWYIQMLFSLIIRLLYCSLLSYYLV